MPRLTPLAIALCLGLSTAAFAQDALYGTWKQDMKRTKNTWSLMKFEAAPDNSMRYIDDWHDYTFALDGTRLDKGKGMTEAWTLVDPHTLKSVAAKDGKVLATDIYSLSADGRTLTDISDDTTVMTRVGEGSGFVGTWKTASTTATVGNTLVVSAAGPGAIHWGPVDLLLDGKDREGKTPGHSMSIKEVSPTSYALTIKDHGTLQWEMLAEIIEGGKVMALHLKGIKFDDEGIDYYVKQ